MNEWLPVPQTDEDRAALVAQIHGLKMTSDQALDHVLEHRSMIMAAESYEQIRLFQGATSSIKDMFRANKDLRAQCDQTYLTGEWRIGQSLLREEQAEGGETYHQNPAPGTRSPEKRVASLAEQVGNRTYGWRLKTVGTLSVEALNSVIQEAQQGEKEATLTGLVKILRAQESEIRRMDSMTAPTLYAPDFRVGDCRLAFPDIETDSVPLIMTDPPYEEAAEPLWHWLAAWANEVLIPGGSLICYFGGAYINRLYRIFDDTGLTHHWPCIMMHEHAQRLAGRFVIANCKPILWYVKDFRRGRTLVPDVVYSARRNKAMHAWGQGEGGVTQWIHQLTDPGELILDPFCGTGEWGQITCREGRRWIGSDIVAGGTTTVAAHEPEEE